MDPSIYQNSCKQFAAYPYANTSNMQEYLYLAASLAEEAGEVAGKIGKAYRAGIGINAEALAKELGDVLWEVAMLCNAAGLDMGTVMRHNIIKLNERSAKGTIVGEGDNR